MQQSTHQSLRSGTWLACSQCRRTFEITQDDQRFLKLFEVPAPTMCPACRLQRRLCECNMRSLYYRKCDLTGQKIISQYNADQPFPVYGIDVWVSDRWDGLTYGRDIDPARPFFDQFKELLNVMPHLALFNTQYSESEYKALRTDLVARMRDASEYGEYFPMELCAFAYNETFAPDFFPMMKEDVVARGWRWYEDKETDKRYMGAEINVPDTIAEVPDALCKQILTCQASGKPYKIIPQELAFYRSMNLPAPILCPDERHRQRISKRNPYKLWKRPCGKCSKEIETTFAPEGHEIVYCDECYLEAVY